MGMMPTTLKHVYLPWLFLMLTSSFAGRTMAFRLVNIEARSALVLEDGYSDP
jgi:hypothetical protein